MDEVREWLERHAQIILLDGEEYITRHGFCRCLIVQKVKLECGKLKDCHAESIYGMDAGVIFTLLSVASGGLLGR